MLITILRPLLSIDSFVDNFVEMFKCGKLVNNLLVIGKNYNGFDLVL